MHTGTLKTAADTDDLLAWVLVSSDLAAFGILIAAFQLAARQGATGDRRE